MRWLAEVIYAEYGMHASPDQNDYRLRFDSDGHSNSWKVVNERL